MMPVTVPAAINLHTSSHSSDPRARGVNGSPSVSLTKIAGNLPITTNGGQFLNNTSSSQTGTPDAYHFEYLASGGHDVSTDSKVLIWTGQWNAPNRIQVSDLANDGILFRIGSGSGSPPSNYKHYQIGGFDTPIGKSQPGCFAMIMDLNDTSNESTTGTFDNTDVQTYGFGCVRFNLSGTSTPLFFPQRAFLFDTEVDGSRPEFTGTGSDWDDLVTAIQGTDYTDKISDDWIRKVGNTVNVYCPFQIGDGVTATTFDDGAISINGPPHDAADDPRFRLSPQAMRSAIRLRNNAADTVRLKNTWNFADSNGPDLDWNVSNLASIDISGFTGIGRGAVLLGSSVSGAATWDRCGTVDATAEPDVDGSTFRAPTDDALLIDSAQTLTDLTFASYTGQVALRINGGASSFTVTLDNCQFDKTGTFEVENSGSGTITLALTNGTTSLSAGDVTNTGGGSIVISASVSVSFEAVDKDDVAIQNVRVTAYLISDDTEVINALTNASGFATTTFSGGTPADIYYRYRKSSTGATKYVNLSGFATVETGSGVSVKRSMTVDTTADPTI